MSRVRYSFTLRGDAPLGPGGTIYAVIGTPIYDSDRNDVGRVSHAQQTPSELQLELEVFGIDWRDVEEREEEGRSEGYDEGAEEVRTEIVSRLANWSVEDIAAVIAEAQAGTVFDILALRAAIVARAEA